MFQSLLSSLRFRMDHDNKIPEIHHNNLMKKEPINTVRMNLLIYNKKYSNNNYCSGQAFIVTFNKYNASSPFLYS